MTHHTTAPRALKANSLLSPGVNPRGSKPNHTQAGLIIFIIHMSGRSRTAQNTALKAPPPTAVHVMMTHTDKIIGIFKKVNRKRTQRKIHGVKR